MRPTNREWYKKDCCSLLGLGTYERTTTIVSTLLSNNMWNNRLKWILDVYDTFEYWWLCFKGQESVSDYARAWSIANEFC